MAKQRRTQTALSVVKKKQKKERAIVDGHRPRGRRAAARGACRRVVFFGAQCPLFLSTVIRAGVGSRRVSRRARTHREGRKKKERTTRIARRPTPIHRRPKAGHRKTK